MSVVWVKGAGVWGLGSVPGAWGPHPGLASPCAPQVHTMKHRPGGAWASVHIFFTLAEGHPGRCWAGEGAEPVRMRQGDASLTHIPAPTPGGRRVPGRVWAAGLGEPGPAHPSCGLASSLHPALSLLGPDPPGRAEGGSLCLGFPVCGGQTSRAREGEREGGRAS